MERENQVEHLDIISKLPDHIIARIISSLPTEEAIRTSILSTRWNYLWKGIHSICLQGRESFNPDRFANLVEHVLDNCKSINSLSINLSFPDIGLTHLNAWVSTALSFKIEKLDLCFHKIILEFPTFTLPECILDCSTLVVLKLGSYFDIRIPKLVCFPHIKSLSFKVILPYQDKVMHQLLSSCPILEELSLAGLLKFENVQNIDICIPTLKKLSLFLEYKECAHYETSQITIDTAILEYLRIDDNLLSRYVVKNLSQVHYVDIMYGPLAFEDLKPKHKENCLELLKGITATELMKLHFYTAIVLGSALSYTWPTFSNLTMLEMFITDDSFGWTCFSRVLHYAPNLKVLLLDLEMLNWDLDDFEPCVWTPPDVIPLCLLENLRIIRVKLIGQNDDEVEAVKYLLQNARVLERMMIDSRGLDEEEMEKLLMCPTASGTCDVQFYQEMFIDIPLTKISVWGI